MYRYWILLLIMVEITEEKTKPETKQLTKRQLKKKQRRKNKKKATTVTITEAKKTKSVGDKVEIEYVPEKLEEFGRDNAYFEFNQVFQRFKVSETAVVPEVVADKKPDAVPIKARAFIDDDEEAGDDNNDEDDKPKMSKKKLKKLNRLTVAELKQLVERPDVVEMHDVTSRDPNLLILLKAARNTVPVPRHWCFKRKYLQGKRGIEKAPFDLPECIKSTGIMEMRQALAEKEDEKSLKTKMRERVRPKMGKIDIDYQKLHDAFFKWQTKPWLSIHGDMYYEGREFEARLKEKKPGNLSDDLKVSLGIPLNSDKHPAPWLIAIQRYGPPPAYPNLKIPGLNAPIPEGASFGYHAGGWGKPPVDEVGKPLYGDVFGPVVVEVEGEVVDVEVEKGYWGEMEEEEDEEEDDEDEDADKEPDALGLVTPLQDGAATPSGTTSVMTMGAETPESLELRKKRIEDPMEAGGDTPELYTVLPERRVGVGAAFVGSTHVYDIPATTTTTKRVEGGEAGKRGEGVEVALEPEELELDMATMKAKYNERVKEVGGGVRGEDLSDLVAENNAKLQRKRKRQAHQNEGKGKKTKEFKF